VADECDMDKELLRSLLCSSGTMDGARRLLNWDACDLSIHLHTVIDTKQHQGLGTKCSAAPTVCACVFGRDCTLKREGTLSCGGKVQQGSCTSVRGKPRQVGWVTTICEYRQEYSETHKCLWQEFCVCVCAEEQCSGRLGWIIS